MFRFTNKLRVIFLLAVEAISIIIIICLLLNRDYHKIKILLMVFFVLLFITFIYSCKQNIQNKKYFRYVKETSIINYSYIHKNFLSSFHLFLIFVAYGFFVLSLIVLFKYYTSKLDKSDQIFIISLVIFGLILAAKCFYLEVLSCIHSGFDKDYSDNINGTIQKCDLEYHNFWKCIRD